MDLATASTIRAIINGLRKSGTISDPHITAILRELEAIEPELARYSGAGQYRVRQLCIDIAADSGVETSIETAEPPLRFNH